MAAGIRAMSLDDVPIELRKLAIAAANANSALSAGERDQTPDHMLAAVLPAHERMVRAQVAQEARDAAAEMTLPAEHAILRWFATRTEMGGPH